MSQQTLKKRLKFLVDNQSWVAVEELKAWVIGEWQKQSIIGDTVEQTGMRALQKEYKIQAINEFFEKLEQMANDPDARAE